jgi:predicted transposase/invertase (TIGR01784 family)
MKNFLNRLRLSGELKRLARKNAGEGKPLSIMKDTVFKAVLTADSEDSREALRLLLSSCTHRPVSSVQILNNEILPEYLSGKTVRLDVHVVFNDGEAADLEMQIDKSGDDLKARSSLYAARLLSTQAKKGKFYSEIKRVYQIFFLNCVLFPQSAKIPRRYFIIEETEHDKLNESMEIIFYEMPKLEKEAKAYFEDKGNLGKLPAEAKWCMFFKYRQEEGMAPLIEELCREEEGIMRVERVLTKMSRDYETWARVLYREKAEMDYYAGIAYARHEGKLEGKIEGKLEGKAEGKIEGRLEGKIEGRLEGKAEEKLEIARKMKEAGDTREKIQAITGLSPEALEKL